MKRKPNHFKYTRFTSKYVEQ